MQPRSVASWFHAISVDMEQWTAQQHAFIVEAYFKNGNSAITTQRLFHRHFNIPHHGHVPCHNTIKEWVQNIRENVSALKRKPRGRIPMVRTPENVYKLRMAIVKSPRHSVRRNSSAIGLSDRSGQRILHEDLNFQPYKTAIVQELNDHDMANHKISSEQPLEMLNDDGVIISLIMTDEAHFQLSGYVNKQNYHYWAPENPQQLHQPPLHSERLTVWCGIASFGVLGPYFFEDNEGAAVTVTSERYVAMLRNFCEPELRHRGINLSSVWFQKDGATAHTARASMSVLREMFPQHVISHGSDVPWPARSPDLSACDYFLWGYLKSRVFISKPRTIVKLKQSIKEEIAVIPEQMTCRVMENLGVRLKQCFRNGGRHLRDVLFKT